jgi:26S proteasome regulatory subunit N10
MVLEAVMVVVDNSESSRNGDYQPTRFDAQADAANIIFQTITNSNPESSVGLMSMGGKGPEVLVTLTTEQGKILEGLHRTKNKILGTSHLATGIQVAGVSQSIRDTLGPAGQLTLFPPAARSQAPPEQVPEAEDNRLCLLPGRGGREEAGSAGQEDEEGQRFG